MTFGQAISSARKQLGLSQKDLAARVIKADGNAISPQYLNDLERDRRNPPSDYLLAQVAAALDLPRDYVYYLAGRYPEGVHDINYDIEAVQEAFGAFRRVLRERSAKERTPSAR